MPNWVTSPLVPQSLTQPIEDKLTQPKANQSPGMAMVKGFGAGALEGLRNMTSPLNLAGAALSVFNPMAEGPAVMEGLSQAAPEAYSAIDAINWPTVERLYQQARPTFEALRDAGTFGGGRTVGSLYKDVQPAVKAATETLGETDPEFTPVGAENYYNVGKAGLQHAVDPALQAYKNLLAAGGR